MIEHRDIQRLKYNAKEFAIMMDSPDIERVIADFVEVKNLRDHYRRDGTK